MLDALVVIVLCCCRCDDGSCELTQKVWGYEKMSRLNDAITNFLRTAKIVHYIIECRYRTVLSWLF